MFRGGFTSGLCVGAITITEAVPGVYDPLITPAVLNAESAPAEYPLEIGILLYPPAAVGWSIKLEGSTDPRMTPVTFTATTVLTQDMLDEPEETRVIPFAGLSALDEPHLFWATIIKPNGDYSAISNIILVGAAVDETPSAFSFTDVNNAELTDVYESNTVTLTGFNLPVAITIAGGEYAIDSGSGFGSWTSAEGVAYPGDQAKVRHTSSGSNSTATNTILTVGGVSDTFTTTTEAAPVTLPTSGLILRLDADDLATLFQTVDGSTTAVATDSDPVGYWGDKSGGGFHLSAAGNDTTRPAWHSNSGLPFVQFDGSNDILRRLAALGLYSGGACTVIAAVRSTNASQSAGNLGLFMEGSSTDVDPVYAVGSGGANTTFGGFIRNDTGTSIPLVSTNTILNGGLDANDTVITFTDNGSTIISYDDGASAVTRTYTRAGTLTLNRFALGGWLRTSAASWLPVKVYAIAAWDRVLDSTERAEALTYMASKQGRSL